MNDKTPLARAEAGCRGAVECNHDTLSASLAQSYFIVFPSIILFMPGGVAVGRVVCR